MEHYRRIINPPPASSSVRLQCEQPFGNLSIRSYKAEMNILAWYGTKHEPYQVTCNHEGSPCCNPRAPSDNRTSIPAIESGVDSMLPNLIGFATWMVYRTCKAERSKYDRCNIYSLPEDTDMEWSSCRPGSNTDRYWPCYFFAWSSWSMLVAVNEARSEYTKRW